MMYGEVADCLTGHAGNSYTDPDTGVTVMWTGDIRVSSGTDPGQFIMQQYIRFGPKYPSELSGSFAIVVYDPTENRTVLARDLLGTVPLYYACTKDDRLVFGTRIDQLLPALGTVEMEPAALLDYLTFFWSLDEKTFFRGIRLVPQGSVYVNGRLESYFDFEHNPQQRNESEWCEAIVDTLTEVVREIGDPAAGCYLSGGIDSSTIAVLMARVFGSPPRTFAGAFPDYANYDESPFGAAVAETIGSEFTRVVARPEYFPQVFASIIETIEEPKCHPPVFPRFLVDTAIHKAGCRTMVSGRGADELFTGYDSHKAECLGDHRSRRTFFGSTHLSRLLRPEFTEQTDYNPPEVYDAIFSRCHGDSVLEQVLDFDVHTLMANWLVLDYKISQRFGIDPVAPFLDRRIVELALAIPIQLKCADNEPKKLLRQAVSNMLPRSVITRKKVGFRTPMGEMFRDGLEPFVRDSLQVCSSTFWDIFEPTEVNALVDEHFAEKHNWGWQIWAMLCVKEWCRRFVDSVEVTR